MCCETTRIRHWWLENPSSLTPTYPTLHTTAMPGYPDYDERMHLQLQALNLTLPFQYEGTCTVKHRDVVAAWSEGYLIFSHSHYLDPWMTPLPPLDALFWIVLLKFACFALNCVALRCVASFCRSLLRWASELHPWTLSETRSMRLLQLPSQDLRVWQAWRNMGT